MIKLYNKYIILILLIISISMLVSVILNYCELAFFTSGMFIPLLISVFNNEVMKEYEKGIKK